MTEVTFNNADVGAKYKSVGKTDQMIHQPGKKGTGFQCKLSQLTLAQADILFKVPNQNHLVLKDAAAGSAALSSAVVKQTNPEEKVNTLKTNTNIEQKPTP